MSIQKQAIKGVKWTTVATLVKALCQIALLSIASRFLDEKAFGIYAIIQITLGFSQLFMDMGVGNAIIQAKHITKQLYSSLFLINLIVAFFISILVYSSSDVITQFFGVDNASLLIEIASLSFLISALFRIHLVYLQKNLSFNVIAKIEIFAQLCSLALAALWLWYGLGVKSLIYGYLVNLAVQAILFLALSPLTLSFSKINSYAEVKPFLGFGVYQTADSTINYFNSQFDLLLIGRLLGNEVLGGYMLVRQFCFRPAMVINPVLTRVAFPIMSRLNDRDRISTVYCKLSAILAAINFPLYLAMIVFADFIIRIVFGEKWLYLTPLFQAMSLWCLVRSTMNPVGALMMALGKVKRLFQWNVILTLFIPLSILIGVQFDLYGVVVALILLQMVLFIIHINVLLKPHGRINIKAYIAGLTKAFALALIASALAILVLQLFTPSYPVFIIALFLFLLGYGGLVYKYNRKLLQLNFDSEQG